MHRRVSALPVALVALCLLGALPAAVVSAKGPVDRITISGPGLTDPIEVKSTALLSNFDPWGRQFIAWDRGLAPAAPQGQPSYVIAFYLDQSGAGSPIYVFDYVPGSLDGPGYIHIPGPDDPRYRRNASTIVGATSTDRWNPDGKWQYATDEWDAAVLQELRAHGVDVSTGDVAGEGRAGGTAATSGGASRLLLFGALALVAAGGAYWLVRNGRRERSQPTR